MTRRRARAKSEPRPAPRSSPGGEGIALLAAVASLQAGCLVAAATYPNDAIGFHQLHWLGLPGAAGALAAIWGAALLAARLGPRARAAWARAWVGSGGLARRRVVAWGLALLLACGSTWAFLRFSNRFVNRDGIALFAKIPEAVARGGVHVTHDEMLELYVHSRLYAALHPALGWSVGECYRVASAVAGGLFVLILALASGALAPRARATFVALALAGGYVQIFFGDVENYTLVTVAVLVYLVAAHRHARGRAPLALPALALAAAMAFHLVAAWLLPSLAFLFLRAWREGRRREAAAGAFALTLPLVAVVGFLSLQGLPIDRLWNGSHAVGAMEHLGRYLAPLDLGYAWGMLNVLLLLAPSAILLPVLALLGDLGRDPYGRFLQIAAGTMILFTFVWRAQLGIFEDWNLFVPGMVPVTVLVARTLARMEATPARDAAVAAAGLTAALHGGLWVLSNHFLWR